jgi:hypothetical protein
MSIKNFHFFIKVYEIFLMVRSPDKSGQAISPNEYLNIF